VRRLFFILPVLAFVALALLFYGNLHETKSSALNSPLLGKPAPQLTLPPLDNATAGIGSADFALKDRVTVVNLFASWCIPCREEAPQLAQLARARGVHLIGIAYKDRPDAARAFLTETGNPYAAIGLDIDGKAGIEWGISGVPETFVIDRYGIVRARFGPLDQTALMHDLLPAILAAAQ
jgi:cytochrome c biogenesis protein CcmG/thiol:disulfide interchange protein DsbE